MLSLIQSQLLSFFTVEVRELILSFTVSQTLWAAQLEVDRFGLRLKAVVVVEKESC